MNDANHIESKFTPSPYVLRRYAQDMETNTRLIDGDIAPYLRKVAEWIEAAQPVPLIDCAMALQGNARIKLGADLKAIARAVLDAARVKYHE